MTSDWVELTFEDGRPLYVRSDALVAIRPRERGAVIYPIGFGDTGWIVAECPRDIIRAFDASRRPPTSRDESDAASNSNL